MCDGIADLSVEDAPFSEEEQQEWLTKLAEIVKPKSDPMVQELQLTLPTIHPTAVNKVT